MKKRKGNKPEPEQQEPGKKGRKDYDDRFYDLDDGFIDDGDLDEDFANNGLNGGAYDDFYTEEPDESNVNASSLNVQYDPKADDKKEQKKYSQIL